MIDELTEEAAALYVFDLLEEPEARVFAGRLAAEPELRQYVEGLQATAAALAHRAPPQALPPGLEARLLQEIQGLEKVISFPSQPRAAWLGWAMAASLAVGACWLQVDRARLLQRLTEAEKTVLNLRVDVAGWQHRDALSRLQIATLTSKLATAPTASAVVVWDEEKQQGVLKLSRLPKPAAGRDYQLWVLDPQYPQPVSAGLLPRTGPKPAQVSFAALKPIAATPKFAVSLEQEGGVPEVKGPIVLVSE